MLFLTDNMATRICVAGAKTGTAARAGMRGWRCGDGLGVRLGVRLRSEMARSLGSGVRVGSTMRIRVGLGSGFGMRFQRRGLLTESYSAGPSEVIGFLSSLFPFIYLQSLMTTKLTTRFLPAATSPAHYPPAFPRHRQRSWRQPCTHISLSKRKTYI